MVLLAAPLSSLGLDFSKTEVERLASGGTVRKPLPTSCKNGFYGGTGFTLVNAPIQIVWKFIQDWKLYEEAFPHIVESKEVYRNGEHSQISMKLGYKILNLGYHLNVSKDWENKTLSFTLAENRPHDIQATRGYWRLFPQPDGKTLVVYAVAAQVPQGISVFLGKTIEKDLERSLIGLPKYLKRYLESPEGLAYQQLSAKHQ